LFAKLSAYFLTSSFTSHHDPAVEERRISALLRQAPIEFARVVYGLSDHTNGRTVTAAAEDVARTVRSGTPVTRERAEQRARAYLPTAGHAHCPRCWVFSGVKSPLRFRDASDERPESATCRACGAEYAT
jgi:hypothetical protein